MNKRLAVTAIVAFALLFSITSDFTLMSAPEFFSTNGAGKTPTIPIFPPVD